MSNAVLTKLADERDELVSFIDMSLSQATEQERDLSENELRTLTSTRERIAAIDGQMKPLQEFEQIRSSAVEIDRRVTTNPRPQKNEQLRSQVNETLGMLFTASEQFRSYSGGTSGRYEMDILPSEVRAPLFVTTQPGQLLLPPNQKYNSQAPNYLTPLLANVQRVQVSTGSVEVVSYTDPSGAAVVPEGELKPEIVTGVNLETVTLEVVAGVLHASRQFLSDVTAAQSWLNSNLTRAVIRELERLLILKLQSAPIPALAANAGEELISWVRRAQATIQSKGYLADTLLAHPDALANIDLQILSLGGQQAARIGQSAWGLESIPVSDLAPEDIYVLDSSAALVLYEKSGIQVFMSDSDILGEGATAQSGFRRNIVTTIAEARAVGHVPVPAAAVKAGPAAGGTVTSAPAGARRQEPSGPATPTRA